MPRAGDPRVGVGSGPLSVEEVLAVARGRAEVRLEPDAEAAIERSRVVVEELAAAATPSYGISTGFGALATRHIPTEMRAQLQKSLVRSHAAGSGPEVENEVCGALMLLRLSTLATGHTGGSGSGRPGCGRPADEPDPPVVPGRERREPQQHQRPGDLHLDLRARTRGVRAHQRLLQLRPHRRRDVPRGQRAEPRRDAVRRRGRRGQLLHHHAGALDGGLGGRVELHRARSGATASTSSTESGPVPTGTAGGVTGAVVMSPSNAAARATTSACVPPVVSDPRRSPTRPPGVRCPRPAPARAPREIVHRPPGRTTALGGPTLTLTVPMTTVRSPGPTPVGIGAARRWTMLGASTLAQAAAAVMVHGPAFLIPVLHEREGLSLARAGLVAAAPTVGVMLTLVAWGAVTDRRGERFVLVTGLVATTVAGALAALGGGTLALALTLVLAGAAAASTNSASGRVVVGWFPPQRRGLAMGVRQMAQPAGVGLAAVSIAVVADRHGLQAALWVPTAACAVAAVVVAAVVVDPPRPERSGQPAANPYRRDRFLARVHGVSVLLVVPQFLVWTFALVWLVQDRGWSPAARASLVAVAQLAGAVGRIAAGHLSDVVASRMRPLRWIALAAAATMAALGVTSGRTCPSRSA